MNVHTTTQIDFDTISHEQAIELLKLHQLDLSQRNEITRILLEKFGTHELNYEMQCDIAFFLKVIVQLDMGKANSAREILNCREVAN